VVLTQWKRQQRPTEEYGTAEHADGGGALQGEDDAFDREARLAEVEYRAEAHACGFHILQALRAMNVVDHLGAQRWSTVRAQPMIGCTGD
jgi:hypothetical protein